MGTKKVIDDPDEMKGMKIRAHGALVSPAIVKLGMIPVSIAANEVYESMDRGVIDGFTEMCIPGLKGIGVLPACGTIIDPAIGAYGTGHLLMNKDVCDEFPQWIKDIQEELYAELLVFLANYNMEKSLPEVEEVKNLGIKVIIMDEAQIKAWKDIIEPEKMWLELAEADEAKYGVPATECLLRYMGLIPVYEHINRDGKFYKSPLG